MLHKILSYLKSFQIRFSYRQSHLFFAICYMLLIPLPAYWVFKTLDFHKKRLEWAQMANSYEQVMGQLLAQIGEYAIIDAPTINEKDPLRDKQPALKQSIMDKFTELKRMRENFPINAQSELSNVISSTFLSQSSFSSLENLWNQIITQSFTVDYATYKKFYRDIIQAGLGELVLFKKYHQNAEDGSALSVLLEESSYKQLPEIILPTLEMIWLQEEYKKNKTSTEHSSIRIETIKELLNTSFTYTRKYIDDTYLKNEDDYNDLSLSKARESLSNYLAAGDKFLNISQNSEDSLYMWRLEGINFLEADQFSQQLCGELTASMLAKQMKNAQFIWNINLLALIITLFLLIAYSHLKILSGHLNLLHDHIENMKKGIFATCFSSHSNDEFGTIGRLLDQVSKSIQDRSKVLQMFVTELTDSSKKIEETTQEQKTAMGEQKENLQNIEEVAAKIALNANELSQVMQQLIQSSLQKDLVEKAKEGLDEMQKKMSDLVTASSTIVTDLQNVEAKVGSTTRLTTFLSRASNKANLLSLNAAIETANIDVQQKDFAEISLKIQRFANRTGTSTKDIQQIIQEISSKVKDVRHEADSCLKEISEGAHRLIDVSQQLAHITQQGKEQIRQFETVNEMTLQQAHAAENNVESIRGMDKTTEESALAIEDLTKTVERLSNTSDEIQQVLEMFTKNKDSNNE